MIFFDTIKTYMKKYKTFLKKLPTLAKRLVKKKKIVISSILVLMMLILSGIGYYIFTISTVRTYAMTFEPSQAHMVFPKDKKAIFNVKISTKPPVGFAIFDKSLPVVLLMNIDNKKVFEKEILFEKNTEESKSESIILDVKEYSDGNHPVSLSLNSKTEKTTLYPSQKTILSIDQTVPILKKVMSQKAYVVRYDLSEDIKASESAKLGISIITNKKDAIPLNFSFSEAGILKFELDESTGSAQLAKEATSEASVIFTSKLNQWEAPFSFADGASNTLSGKVIFSYDSVAPTINIIKDYRIDKNAKDTFFLTFTASEPLAFAKATVNGTTKFATGTYKGYRIGAVPVNEGNNTITVVGQDLAGNTTTVQLQANVVQLKTYSFENFGKSTFKKCTVEDSKACGFPSIFEQGCDGMKKYKVCMETRCDNKVSVQNCE
jgi:hypothetical protein